MGTGDGRLPFRLAVRQPERFFFGLDASVDALRALSGRALRERPANLAYVRAAAEDLPQELHGCADAVTVVLPWGSLLAAVAQPQVAVLRGLRGLCQEGAPLQVVLGLDPARDRAALERLGLPPLDEAVRGAAFAHGYEEAGFTGPVVRALEDAPARYPSTWAARLAHGGDRRFVDIVALAR